MMSINDAVATEVRQADLISIHRRVWRPAIGFLHFIAPGLYGHHKLD